MKVDPRVETLRVAVVPAAGRGARLDRPGTPKPLVEVGGIPLIVRVLEQLAAAGIEEAIIVLGFEAAAVIRALSAHPRLSLRLRFVEEPGWERGLATSLAAARPYVDGPFVIAMADHVFDSELVAAIAREIPAEGDVVAVVDREPERVFALEDAVRIALDGDRVTAIGALDRYDAVDVGLFAATPALFDALDAAKITGGALSDALAVLARANRVRAIHTDGRRWDDIDTPAAAVHAEMRLRGDRRRQALRRRETPMRDPEARYRFVTGTPTTTELVVRRGAATGDRVELGIPPDSASSPLFVLTDETVNRLYGDRFVGALERDGYDVQRVVMPEGEQAKTLENFGRLTETVLSAGIDEHSVLISLGGGVVCNVSGFAAATLYRGIGLIHVPTTLMAQCDAAISHKQALNGARGKNLVGAYYAPCQIVVDVDFLQTLSDRLLRDGLAEALKHALAQDASYLAWFMVQGRELRDPAFLEHVVRRNIELKCRIMAEDPRECSSGLVLQYAHNVAHAVEYLSGYHLTHGESVAIGMVVAARVSRILGGCGDDLVETHERLLERYDLPRRIPRQIRVPDIIDALRYDKKALTEGVRMALLSGVGRMWQVDHDFAIPVAESVLAQALEASRA